MCFSELSRGGWGGGGGLVRALGRVWRLCTHNESSMVLG